MRTFKSMRTLKSATDFWLVAALSALAALTSTRLFPGVEAVDGGRGTWSRIPRIDLGAVVDVRPSSSSSTSAFSPTYRNELHEERGFANPRSGPAMARRVALWMPRGGGAAPPSVNAKTNDKNKKAPTKSTTSPRAASLLLPSWFRPSATQRERQLSAALLVWNALAIVDAVRFTFCAQDNLRGYFVEAHRSSLHPQVIVMTRFLANCQWAYLATSILVALTAPNELVLKSAFGIAIGATAGAFRAVQLGIDDGVVQAPWKSKYASLLTLPPLLLLSYFAFWF